MFVIRKVRMSGMMIEKKRMLVKFFNGCSERQRHAIFYVIKWVILTDVRKKIYWMFVKKSTGCS